MTDSKTTAKPRWAVIRLVGVEGDKTESLLADLRGLSGFNHIGQTAIRAAEEIERLSGMLAHLSKLSEDDHNRLVSEIDRLRAGIQAMLDGNYPHPGAYKAAGGKCPHGIWYYDDCSECNEAWLSGII